MPPCAECSARFGLEKFGGESLPVVSGQELQGVVGGVRTRNRPNELWEVFSALAEKGSLSGHVSVAAQGLGMCAPVLGRAFRARSSTGT